MVSSTPRPHFTPGKDPVSILQEAGLAPGLVWTGGKSRPHQDSIPDHSARSSVAIPTELPGPLNKNLMPIHFMIRMRCSIFAIVILVHVKYWPGGDQNMIETWCNGIYVNENQ